MLTILEQKTETNFDNPITRTIGLELKGNRLHRIIKQIPIWNTKDRPRLLLADQVNIPRELEFSYQATAEALRAHDKEMGELAHKVQAKQASLRPCVVFYDGRQCWCASNFENLVASAKVFPQLRIPSVVFEGDREDAITFAINNSAKIKRIFS